MIICVSDLDSILNANIIPYSDLFEPTLLRTNNFIPHHLARINIHSNKMCDYIFAYTLATILLLPFFALKSFIFEDGRTIIICCRLVDRNGIAKI